MEKVLQKSWNSVFTFLYKPCFYQEGFISFLTIHNKCGLLSHLFSYFDFAVCMDPDQEGEWGNHIPYEALGYYVKCSKISNISCLPNSADPDQTASEEAVWSESSLFAILTSILWIPALKTNILFECGNRKVFKSLEHLPYEVKIWSLQTALEEYSMLVMLSWS